MAILAAYRQHFGHQSFRRSATYFGVTVSFLSEHYPSLGQIVEQRCATYSELFVDAIGQDRLDEIRAYVQQQRAWSSTRFQSAIETELRRAATVRPRGRPQRIRQMHNASAPFVAPLLSGRY